MKDMINQTKFFAQRPKVLKKGRWGNADIYLYYHQNQGWIVKDFSPCKPIIYKTWGRLLISREYHALSKLSGIKGIPSNPILLNNYALSYQYLTGQTLRKIAPEQISNSFFYLLEDLVQQIHNRGIVHLDIRHRGNVLITTEGLPALIDFQSSLNLENVPSILHHLLKEIDFSGVYKLWQKKKPETLDTERRSKLESFNKMRFLWILKGYPFGTRTNPRK